MFLFTSLLWTAFLVCLYFADCPDWAKAAAVIFSSVMLFNSLLGVLLCRRAKRRGC
jgi:hypothetical protein